MTKIIAKPGFVEDRFAGAPVVALEAYAGNGAVLLSVEDDPCDVPPHFETLRLIVIPFATSGDGRGFSLASTLRALGYRGHLRAKGRVLVDQFRAALRCGFDDIEISDEQALRNPEAQWQAIPLGQSYQTHIAE